MDAVRKKNILILAFGVSVGIILGFVIGLTYGYSEAINACVDVAFRLMDKKMIDVSFDRDLIEALFQKYATKLVGIV